MQHIVVLSIDSGDPSLTDFHHGLLSVGSQIHGLVGDFKRVLEANNEAVRLNAELGFPVWKAISKIRIAYARARMGETAGAVDQIREGLAEFNAIKFYLTRTFYLGQLAETQALAGEIEDAIDSVKRALEANPDELLYRPNVLRLRGELRLKQGQTQLAEADFREAIALAQKMSAKSWELRATMSLARLLQNSARHDEARAMLADIYNWFTEGFDTADLKDAKALLEELNG